VGYRACAVLFLSWREIPIFVTERQIANTDKTLEQLKMIPTAKSASAEEIPDYGYLMADGHSREFIWGKKSHVGTYRLVAGLV